MRPDTFLVGAPKCGTTSLFHWLGEHPDVFFPAVKEPHFFALLRADRTVRGLDEYLRLYRDADRRAIVDGSTTYLHTPGALEAVRAFAPDARIVVVVRDPIELVRSLHAYKLARRQEDVPDFEAAWRLGPDRRAGRCLPPRCGDVYQVVYGDMGLLGARLERVHELFERVHVVVFDDLVADPAATYRALLAFLELPDDGRTDFAARNVTGEQDGRLVYAIASRLPGPVKRGLRLAGLGGSRFASRRATTEPRTPLRLPFHEELRAWYRADVQLLGRRLGRDLSHWLEGA